MSVNVYKNGELLRLDGARVEKTQIYNGLDSNSTDSALSAAQGKVLNTNKPDKSKLGNATILASGWTGEQAPYTNVIQAEGVTATNVVEIVTQDGVTMEQIKAFQSAQILNATQSAGNITLYAYGTKPEIDLPITIIVRGDL